MKVEKLLDVVQIKNPKPEKYSGEKRYYSTGNIDEYDVSENFEIVKFENRPSRANVQPIENSVGFAKMKSTAKTILVTKNYSECIFSTGINFLVPSENIISKYLYYYLISPYFLDLKDKYSGQGIMGGLSNKNLNLFKIPVPSLQEQEKIVERLDKVFENIDKLIEDSAKNIENGKNLFFSFLNETFIGNGSEDLIELEKLSTYISRGLQPKYTDKSKTLVINQRCIRDNQINFEVGRYHDQNIKKVSDDKKIQIGDILINSTGVGTLGRVAQVTELPDVDVTVDTHVTIFRPNFNILNKEFTNWLFVYLENIIEKMGVGASGQTELRREDLKNMKIITPPNEKVQQDISEKLNKLKNPYDNYLRLKEDLIIKYSVLRKSILNKEFSYE